jgi:hypothetical protein
MRNALWISSFLDYTPTMAPLSATMVSPSCRTGDFPSGWISLSSRGANLEGNRLYCYAYISNSFPGPRWSTHFDGVWDFELFLGTTRIEFVKTKDLYPGRKHTNNQRTLWDLESSKWCKIIFPDVFVVADDIALQIRSCVVSGVCSLELGAVPKYVGGEVQVMRARPRLFIQGRETDQSEQMRRSTRLMPQSNHLHIVRTLREMQIMKPNGWCGQQKWRWESAGLNSYRSKVTGSVSPSSWCVNADIQTPFHDDKNQNYCLVKL